MLGVIDVGGGMRAVFACGVLDYCMEQGIRFPYCIGVSAGSANLASFLAGQKGRNLRFYRDYAMRKEYMSLSNFFRHGSYLDLDYIYSTLANRPGEDPLDYDAFRASESRFVVVAADAQTGKPRYFDRNDMGENQYNVLKASSCIPIVCRPYFIDGRPFFDGGIADPIPLERALRDGCTRLVLLLSRPRDYQKTLSKSAFLYRMLLRKYPLAVEDLLTRHEVYNRTLKRAKELESEGKLLILAPDSVEGADTLTRDRSMIENLYQKGYRAAEQIPAFLSQE